MQEVRSVFCDTGVFLNKFCSIALLQASNARSKISDISGFLCRPIARTNDNDPKIFFLRPSAAMRALKSFYSCSRACDVVRLSFLFCRRRMRYGAHNFRIFAIFQSLFLILSHFCDISHFCRPLYVTTSILTPCALPCFFVQPLPS